MLKKVKLAIPISTEAFDDEIGDLILAAKADLGIVGVPPRIDDPLIQRAIITYCRCNFGHPEDYDRLKASYDEQKAQLLSASGYGLPKRDAE